MQDIMDLVNRNDTDALEALYQVPHWNAWFNVDYRGNPEGIFTAACPPEALYVLDNGIMLHCLREVFGTILTPTLQQKLDCHVQSCTKFSKQKSFKSF